MSVDDADTAQPDKMADALKRAKNKIRRDRYAWRSFPTAYVRITRRPRLTSSMAVPVLPTPEITQNEDAPRCTFDQHAAGGAGASWHQNAATSRPT